MLRNYETKTVLGSLEVAVAGSAEWTRYNFSITASAATTCKGIAPGSDPEVDCHTMRKGMWANELHSKTTPHSHLLPAAKSTGAALLRQICTRHMGAHCHWSHGILLQGRPADHRARPHLRQVRRRVRDRVGRAGHR